MKGLVSVGFSSSFLRFSSTSQKLLLEDFEAERPLYMRSLELVRFLQEWRLNEVSRCSSSPSSPFEIDGLNQMARLFVEVSAHGLFDEKERIEEELAGLFAWVATLRRLHFDSRIITSPLLLPSLHLGDLQKQLLFRRPVWSPMFKDVLAVVHVNHMRWSNVPLWKALYPELEEVIFYVPGASPCPSSFAGLKIQCIR
jgi:hypothetical protein